MHRLVPPPPFPPLLPAPTLTSRLGGWAAGRRYFGCIVGRVANRIAKGKFSVGGKEYSLAINNEPNTLHGGPTGYNKQLWKATPIDAPGAPPSLALTLQDPDGHEGYPGDVSVSVTYTLTDDNELKIDMTATTNAPTPLVSPTLISGRERRLEAVAV